jgi:hypothetical protein
MLDNPSILPIRSLDLTIAILAMSHGLHNDGAARRAGSVTIAGDSSMQVFQLLVPEGEIAVTIVTIR